MTVNLFSFLKFDYKNNYLIQAFEFEIESCIKSFFLFFFFSLLNNLLLLRKCRILKEIDAGLGC